MLVGVLDHDDGRIDHRAERDCDPTQAHDVGADAERVHTGERHQNADRQRQDRDQCAADMQQEDDADQRDDDALFDQRTPQRIDRRVNQLRPVIDRHDRHALGQPGLQLIELFFDVADRRQSIDAIPLQRDPADNLTGAVHLGNAAAFVRPKLNARHIFQQHWCAAALRIDFEHDIAEIGGVAKIAAATDHVFGLAHLDRPATHVAVAGTDCLGDAIEGNPVGLQFAGIDDDLVLPLEPADAGDFGDPFGRHQLEAHDPVLDTAQFGESSLRAEHDILVDPADTAGVRSKRRRHAFRQTFGREVQIFEHAAACPIEVSAVLEDDIDERDAEIRKSAHDLGARHRQQRRAEGIGHLILDHLRCLAGILGVDDHLRVREVGERIERRLEH